MKIVSEGICELGLLRSENQDSILTLETDGYGLYLVADGMGGHSDGAKASRILTKACESWWMEYMKLSQKPEFLQTLAQLRVVLGEASNTIWQSTRQGEICGSTVVLLWIQDGCFAVISSGDSRCYRVMKDFIGQKVVQITTDDIWENQMEQIRGFTKNEISRHPNKGKLNRAAGVTQNFSCNVRTDSIDDHILFALCSDGIYKYCSENFLQKKLSEARRSGHVKKAVQQIKEEVYRNKARDNLSLILVYIMI